MLTIIGQPSHCGLPARLFDFHREHITDSQSGARGDARWECVTCHEVAWKDQWEALPADIERVLRGGNPILAEHAVEKRALRLIELSDLHREIDQLQRFTCTVRCDHRHPL